MLKAQHSFSKYSMNQWFTNVKAIFTRDIFQGWQFLRTNAISADIDILMKKERGDGGKT